MSYLIFKSVSQLRVPERILIHVNKNNSYYLMSTYYETHKVCLHQVASLGQA